MLISESKTNMKKYRVLYVDQGLAFGGSFIVAARLASKLNADEFDASIISSAPLGDMAHHADGRVKLIFLRKILTYKHRANFQSYLDQYLKATGSQGALRKLMIYSYSALESIANFHYFLGICYQIVSRDINIVHGNNSYEAITAARFLKKKLVWHIHGDGCYTKGDVHNYFRFADRYVSVSNFSAVNAIKAGLPKEKIAVIHNPTGDSSPILKRGERIALKNKYGISDDATIVGIFGRLVNWKGQLEFLKAAQLLVEKGCKLHFLIVGDDGEGLGTYTKVLVDFVNLHGLEKLVSFTGYVKNTDDHYQLCDIVVHASIMPEPFGLVIIEAMINGAAIIGSNTGAAPELVKDKVNGLIADPLNTSELASAIEYLVVNPLVRQQYIETAKKFAEASLNPSVYARQMEKIYSEL
jgi:glycosyltransferase involved in cell wall biosynthesis